ncbi:MAG: hypothetical protein J5677_05340 [Bacteroidales bacterium]|nr:hypothetical protein [Bacteroidales bacterium]
MNIDEQLQELSQLTCPRQVDVVDAVMNEVRQHPYLMPNVEMRQAASPRHRKVVWRRIALTAVAAMAALVVINLSFRPSYNEEQIGTMLAYVSDYDYYLPVEELAENPIEFLYDDYNE